MTDVEKLCLQWDDFKDNIQQTFGELRGDADFADVTLVSEDGQQLQTHKLILASSSLVFKDLLENLKNPHPLVYMRGIGYENLTSVLDFLYFGEVNILQENLNYFLAVAQELKLKGLVDIAEPSESPESVSTKKAGMKKEPPFTTPLKYKGQS